MKAQIVAIRYALPEKILDNEELAAQYPGWSADKIYEKTGIRRRHIAAPDECASDLAVLAGRKLIDDIGLNTDIDYLLCCTETPDYVMPTTACLLQHRLGIKTACGALDFNLGCSGFLYGLGLSKGLIESGQARSVLLLTADTASKFVNPADKSVRTLFGDGAAAILIVASDQETLIGPFVYGSDGSGSRNIIIPAGGWRHRREAAPELIPDDSGNARTVNDLYMNGAEVFNFTLRIVPKVVNELLTKAGINREDVDLYVFHQANRYMLDHLRRKLQIPEEKFVIAMEDIGNTVSSSIPIALVRAQESGQLVPGALVMLLGFGVGYSWGATFIRWGSKETS